MERTNANIKYVNVIFIIGILLTLVSIFLPYFKGLNPPSGDVFLQIGVYLTSPEQHIGGIFNAFILLMPIGFVSLLLISISLEYLLKSYPLQGTISFIAYSFTLIHGVIASVMIIMHHSDRLASIFTMLGVVWILILMTSIIFILRILTKNLSLEQEWIIYITRFTGSLSVFLWFMVLGLVGTEMERGIVIARIGSGIVLASALFDVGKKWLPEPKPKPFR